MAENFELKIISPEKAFYEGTADFLEFTTTEGEMGVYAKHIPLTAILEPCVMTIHQGEEKKKAAVIGGFVEILPEKITVLAEDAQWPDEIDKDRAEAAYKRAKDRLSEKKDNLDVLRAELAIKRAIARLETIE